MTKDKITLKDKTAKGLFWGGISNVFQQLLGLAFGIFFARILSAEDYGLIGLLSIFNGIAISTQEGGFIAALTNKKDIKDEDYNSVFFFNILTATIIYIILFLCAPLIAAFFNREELIWISRVVFLGFLFGSFGVVQAAYLFKNVKAKEKAKIDLFSLLLSNSITLFLALKGLSYWALAIQIPLYLTIGTIFRWYYSPWRPSLTIKITPLREMLPFSIKLLLTNLFNQFSSNVMSVLLGRFYPVIQVGYFTQSTKWMNMNKSVITGAVNGVAQPIFSEVIDDRERQINVLRKMLRFTSFVSFPLMFGLAFVAKEFIEIFLSTKWLPSVPILQILCVWGAFSPICDLYKNIIISSGRSDIYLWNHVIFGIVQLLLLLSIINYGIIYIVITYTSTYILWTLIWHYFTYRILSLKLISVINDIAPYLIITLISLSISYIVIKLFVFNVYWSLIIKFFITVSVYTLLLWKLNSKIFNEFVQYLFKKE